MATVLPVEIARMITDYIQDKKTFLNLLTDVSFLGPIGQNHAQFKYPSEADLLGASGSFLDGITAGGGRCARYVKRLYLPGSGFLQRELYKLLQTILQALPNLEDLQVHRSWWMVFPFGFNLQALFESPPPFQLQGFGWYTPGNLDRVGLDWFLSHQISLERLFLPSLNTSPSPFTPTLPRLRILHALDNVAARRFLTGNQVTQLKLERDDIHELDDTTLRTVVFCVSRFALLGSLSTVVARMPNLERLEINASAQSIPLTLVRLAMLKGAAKLRHLRILTCETVTGRTHVGESPWDYRDVAIAFNSLPSLTHMTVQLTYAPSFPEYYCFARGAARPVKLRSVRPAPEWWQDDWVDDYVVVPFEPGDKRMGYTGHLLHAAREVLPISVESHIS
ncbi:hypothetical protein PC9H_002841 [Pleurotus ostreatus]|uniref:Uncharacterized protein n=1 Tax=Pleurotus ostreatus TaxID=5322 RepID=A0A8H6ZX81_PLEOS|nr:uncharacterized protein PC9H_002841 [Pleurotus ostreatus]KAF7436015.1 hypothetical protein PC9H_002841 [Pleurotus ostreatus]KAJ8688826.1 hypothetical protein PTI98_013571 [Pleurotus ostreatus]